MFLKKKIHETIKTILRNPGINVNELLKKTRAIRDPKKILDELEKQKIIYSTKKGNQRQLYANFATQNWPLFEFVEFEEWLQTKEKYPVLSRLAKRVDTIQRITGSNLQSIVLFGSFARQAAIKNSDIDLLLIFEDQRKIPEQKIHKLFQNITIETQKEINPVWIEKKEFKAQLANPTSFAKQVQQNRIILFGTKNFLAL